MHDVIRLSESPAETDERLVARMLERYENGSPRFDGTVEALASSSNQSVIDAVFELANIASAFEVTEVARGGAHYKPAPWDVSVEPRAAVEFHGTSVSQSRTRETGSTRTPPESGGK